MEKINYGSIALKILATMLVISLGTVFFINITPTYNEYYSYDDEGNKQLVGRETVNVWDGSAKMRAKTRSLEYEDIGDILKIIKKAHYKDNIVVTEIKLFGKNESDIEQFPLNSQITCENCAGKILSITYDKLLYEAINTTEITSPFRFNPNMKLEWDDGAYYSKFFNYKTTTSKIIIKYRPVRDIESYNVKLVDPILSFSKEDIVTKSYVKEESDRMTYCAYRTICNPTDLALMQKLEYYKSDNGHSTEDLGVEYRQEYQYEECVPETIVENVYDSKNDTYYDTSTYILCSKNVSKTGERWAILKDINIDTKRCIETRQCVKKQNNLDPINTEVHIPLLGYDLKEYTLITSAGLNISVFNSSIIRAYYALENTTISDSSKNSNTGTNQGVAFPAGMIGLGGDFERGETDYVDLVTDTVLFGADPVSFSINLWTKLETIDGTSGVTIGCYTSESGGDTAFPIYTYFATNEVPYAETRDLGGSKALTTTFASSTGTWYMVTITFIDSGTSALYIDTSSKDTDATTLSGDSSDGGMCRLGVMRYNAGFIQHLDGMLDEVSIMDGQISTDYISLLYNSGAAFNPTNETYGVYNSTGTFNQVNITSSCTDVSDNINISINGNDFVTTTTSTQHNFASQVKGFYLNVDSSQCSRYDIFVEIGNFTATPTVNALSPADDASVGVAEQSFVCNITATNVSTMKLFINGTLNITNSSKANDINYTFTTNIPEGDTGWLCEGCNDFPTPVCVNTTERTITLGLLFTQGFCSPYAHMDNISWQINTSSIAWDVDTFRFNSTGGYPADLGSCIFNLSHNFGTDKQLNATINASFKATIPELCYQEFANVSTSCSGLSTGIYLSGGANWTNVANSFDGDYSTKADCYFDGSSSSCNMTVTYFKPTNAESSSLFEWRGTAGWENETIPDVCWDEDNLTFIAWSDGNSAVTGEWYCRDTNNGSSSPGIGVGWETMDNWASGPPGIKYLYEESIWWNLSLSTPNITVDCFNATNISTSGTVVDSAWDGSRILVNCSMNYYDISFNESSYDVNITWAIG